jgi:hypothetical protein
MMKAPDIISDMKEHNKQILSENNNKIKSSSSITDNTNSLLVQTNKTKSANNNVQTTTMNKDVTKAEFDKYLLENKINVLKCNNQIKELHTLLRDRYVYKVSVC